jgi:putative transposase
MARPLRIEYEGAAYHIISRENRAEYIFLENKDKEYFIETIKKAADKYAVELCAP